MSEFARQAVPIVVMYGFVLLLLPFIGYAMWLAFDGDSLREPDADAVEANAAAHAGVQPTATVQDALGAA